MLRFVKNEARNHYDELKRRRNRQVYLSELSQQEMAQLLVTDDYPSDSSFFQVMGFDIAIRDELIAQAISILPDEKRDIILLSYFLGMTDVEIGKTLNMVRRTVQYKRTSSLQELKKLLEGKEND